MKHVLFFTLLCILFSSCAQQQDLSACAEGDPYGFLGGLWHGVIAPFSFIGSLFSDDIAVFAPNNNGGWYTFGFLLGIGALTGGSSRAV